MVQNRIRKGFVLSPTLFNLYIQWIMSDALEEHNGKVSISSRKTCIINLHFAEDTDAVAEEEQEQETRVESINKTCTSSWHKMEISAEEINLMINSSNAIHREIKLKGQRLGTVTSFIMYSEQLFLIMAQNLRFSQGLRKPLQLLQS